MQSEIKIPMRWIGPFQINQDKEVMIPVATYETTLWPSMQRGAKLSQNIKDGFRTLVESGIMTRSIVFRSESAREIKNIIEKIDKQQVATEVLKTSKYTSLTEMHYEQVGNLLFIRLSFTTQEASGHNMTTKAADAVIKYLLEKFIHIRYISISGNYCVDKKNSAINGILGRGTKVISDCIIPREKCIRILKTTPEKIVEINTVKNLMGSIISGGVRTANAHFANMLLAIYIATGQDSANIVEGSQGFTFAEVQDGNLYFSVTLPNIIIGTIGNGKNIEILNQMKIQNKNHLASIIAGGVLAGEISLLAAQTNIGELTESHMRYER